MYSVKGTLKQLGKLIHVGAKNFQKQDVIIETEGKYPQVISLEAFGDVVQDLGLLKTGESYNFKFALRGREWTDKNGEVRYFNTISLIEVEGVKKPKSNYAQELAAAVNEPQVIDGTANGTILEKIREENKNRVAASKSALTSNAEFDNQLPF